MGMKPAAAKMTYDQHCLLPEEGKHYELIDGEFFATPAPTPRHQQILKRLAFQLPAYIDANGLGEVYPAPVNIVQASNPVPALPG